MSQPKTTLLVDDNDELREATREHLEDKGCAVTAAASAEEALRAAESVGENFDLLISDVYMPGMNGVELADRLLEDDPELADRRPGPLTEELSRVVGEIEAKA